MGLFSKISDRIAEEKAAWDESSQALSENATTRQRKQDKKNTNQDQDPPAGDGGAGAIANIIAN